jgi:hypothetical protein
MATGLYSGASGLALGVGLYKGVSGLWGGASGLINGFGGSVPFPGASLYLDFLTPPLDSRITFTRGTNATLTDSTGRITYAPANLLLRSEEFDNVVWGKTSGGLGVVPVVTANADVAPDGTTTADRIQFSVPGNTNGSGDFSVAVQIPAGSGPALRSSVWMRSNTGTNQTVFIRAGDTFLSLTVTPTWQRYSVTQSTASTAFTFNIGIRGSVTPNVTSADVLVWGAQLEPVTYQTTPSTYNPTTASAYYGPRFDYDPVTLAPRGLLIEEARTNLLTYSAAFDNAGWVKTRASVTANVTTAPDGTVSADKLIEDTASNTHITAQNITITTATNYTYSIYLKAAERTSARVLVGDTGGNNAVRVDVNLSTGAVSSGVNGTGWTLLSATATAVGDGWYRVTVAGTSAAVTTGTVIIYLTSALGTIVYTGDGTSGIFVWGAQLEVGSFATSYIPTVASQVARNADVATITGQNFSQWYNQSAGAFVAEYSSFALSSPNSRVVSATNDGTNNNRISHNVNPSNNAQTFIQVAAATQANLLSVASIGTAPVRYASAYRANDFAASLNGGAVEVDAAGTVPTVNQLGIGNSIGSNAVNGHIRSITYYPTRLSNAQLQALTA